jgi:hypothetical protein
MIPEPLAELLRDALVILKADPDRWVPIVWVTRTSTGRLAGDLSLFMCKAANDEQWALIAKNCRSSSKCFDRISRKSMPHITLRIPEAAVELFFKLGDYRLRSEADFDWHLVCMPHYWPEKFEGMMLKADTAKKRVNVLEARVEYFIRSGK